MEQWRSIAGFYGFYEVSDLGRVRSLDRIVPRGNHTKTIRGVVLRPGPMRGYLFVNIARDGEVKNRKIHHLVLETFIGPCPEGHECRHHNGNRADNRLENLSWGTPMQNNEDKTRHGSHPVGERNGSAKLNVEKVLAIRSAVASGRTYKDVASEFGINHHYVGRIVKGTSWSHVPS
jgi:hypothetical protein